MGKISNADYRRMLEQRAQTDFYTFLVLVFPEINSGDFVETDHVKHLAFELQKMAESGQAARALISAPPRHFKTFVISVAFAAWLLGRNPALKIVGASYNAEYAEDLGRQSRKIMLSDIFRRIFPDCQLTSKKPAAGNLETTANGGRFATSITGTLTGKGAHVILVDDPIKAQDGNSQVVRDNVATWLKETALTRFDSPNNALAIVTHQRLHREDPIGRLQREGGWTDIVLPAIFQKPTTLRIGPTEVRQYEPGDILMPQRFDLAWMDAQLADLGPTAFSAQYLQQPILEGGGLLKLVKIKRFDLPPTIRRQDYEALLLSVDTGSSTEPGSDCTAITLWGIRGEKVFLLNMQQGRWDLPTQIEKVSAWHKKVDGIVIERTPAGIGLSQMLVAAGVDRQVGFTPRGDKPLRAQRIALAMEKGRLYFPREAEWLPAVEEQFVQFPHGGGHDDIVDTASQLFIKLEDGLPLWIELGFYRPRGADVNVYTLGGSKIQQMGLKSY